MIFLNRLKHRNRKAVIRAATGENAGNSKIPAARAPVCADAVSNRER